jgi:Mg2+/Co2+ transporter CorC
LDSDSEPVELFLAETTKVMSQVVQDLNVSNIIVKRKAFDKLKVSRVHNEMIPCIHERVQPETHGVWIGPPHE